LKHEASKASKAIPVGAVSNRDRGRSANIRSRLETNRSHQRGREDSTADLKIRRQK
jgi:hypothetical protein